MTYIEQQDEKEISMLKDEHIAKKDFCEEGTMVQIKHVSPCTNETTAVGVPELASTAFEKVDVEVPEVTRANGSTNDVINAVRFSVQCPGIVPGMFGTILFLENLVSEFELVGVLPGPAPHENGESPMANKMTSEVDILDLAHAEHVSENENGSGTVSLPVRASLATAATKECIVGFDEVNEPLEGEKTQPEVLVPDMNPVVHPGVVPDMKPVDHRGVVQNVKSVDQPLKGEKVNSRVVLYVNPVDQSLEAKEEDKPLKGEKVESGVGLDVKPVDRPVKGENIHPQVVPEMKLGRPSGSGAGYEIVRSGSQS